MSIHGNTASWMHLLSNKEPWVNLHSSAESAANDDDADHTASGTAAEAFNNGDDDVPSGAA